MTRKHFVEAANRIAVMDNREDATIVAHFLVDYFGAYNPAFDRNRFLAACKVWAR